MIVNNTIVANKSKTGAGILLNSNSSGVTIANNIIAYNQTGWGICQILATGITASTMNPNSSSITRNLFYQNSAGNSNFPPLDSVANVIGEDPLLTDYPAWDYHLTCESPAYNQGSNFQVPTEILSDFVWDVDGPPDGRFGPDGTVDIGGDEFWETAKKADFVASVTVGCMPLTVDFTNQSLCLDEQWIWSFGDGQGEVNKSPSHTYDTAGIYTVQLIARGDLDSDTLTRNAYIHVSAPLTLDFTADTARGCGSLTVTFTADLNTTADSVRWSFGDDQTATVSPVTHAYTRAGTYSVGLTAYNICGPVSKLKLQYIYVGSKPDIDIAASSDSVPPPLCSPYTVRFHTVTDQPLVTWSWDFGDNGTSTVSNPSHLYDSGGTYSVRLIATGHCGVDTMVRRDFITVLTRPTATLSADPVTGCAGKLTVDFSATYVGSVTSSIWLFDDGDSASGPVARHSYSSLGVYHPSLILINRCGTDTLSLNTPITVGVPPVAGFSGTPLLGYEPLTVQFTDLSTNAPTVWNWSFGDGVTGTETNPSHVYSAGLFDVSLADSNACGSSTDTKRQYIRVGGFLPSFDSSGVRGDTILYSVRVDSLSRSYDRAISLSGRVTTLPRRGTVTFRFVNPTGTPEFTTTMKAVPSGDLATGDYSIELSALDPRITKTATRPLHFAGRQFISVTPDTMQFGTKVIGGLYSKQAYVRNNAGSSSGYKLRFTTSDSGQGFEVSETGGTINPQESTSVQVYFAPTRRADFLGALTINSDDPARPVYRVVLRGRGTPDLTPPQVSATVPPTAFAEIGIDSTVRFIFNEPVVAPSAESLVIGSGRRTAGPVNGLLTFSSGSPTQPWSWMDFTPLPCQWFPSDDTVSFRVLTVIVDTSGNHLDGNKNGADEGSPTDDYLFSISTGPGVRPGDADQNKRVDERDILPLARFWGLTGLPRENQCPGFAVQPATAWSPRAATHADADGNGVVDSADICPIAQYFDVDSSLSKAAIEAWMSDAKNWDDRIIRALIGGLIDCPEESRGREVLHRFLDGLQTVTAAPLEFSLAQNYPNPFNPATVIEYSLKLQTEVRLEIFDIQGRLVTVLENSEQQPGRHARIWDGRDAEGRPVASGIYFYRLVTPEFRLARKMVLMK
jgi:PKD repeat protein